MPEFKPELDLEFQFLEGNEQQKYLHICKITELIPGEKITYSWRYVGSEGNSFVTFELYPEGDNTHLRLTHAGVETFPASDTNLSKENHADGWNYLINKALKVFLEK